MKSIRCIFGFHDYEIISEKDDTTLRNEVTPKKKGKPSIGLEYSTDRIRYKKICLRCEHFLDEITPAEDRFKKEKIRNLARVRKAKQILHEMKYRKRNRVTVTARYNTVPTACCVCSGSLYEDNLGIYNCNDCGKQHESF